MPPTTQNEDVILSYLRQHGQMTVPKLAAVVRVAQSTVRRNLAKLEKAGVARRVVITASPKTFGWDVIMPEPAKPEPGPGNPAADGIDELLGNMLEDDPGPDPPKGEDCELSTMRAVYTLLEPLPKAKRRRVVVWLTDKLDLN